MSLVKIDAKDVEDFSIDNRDVSRSLYAGNYVNRWNGVKNKQTYVHPWYGWNEWVCYLSASYNNFAGHSLIYRITLFI